MRKIAIAPSVPVHPTIKPDQKTNGLFELLEGSCVSLFVDAYATDIRSTVGTYLVLIMEMNNTGVAQVSQL